MKTNIYISILLVIILALGAAVRTYKILEWMPWESDVGRDMVVANRIIQDRGPYNIQVTSGSSSRFVVNSPMYYWITTMLYKITNSPSGIVIVYALWNVAGIFFSYYIGKLSGDRLLGLLFSAFVSSNYFLVVFSQQIWQPSILPTLTLLSLLLIMLAIVKINVYWLLLLINISFLGLHFHYSYYPIVLINTLWIAIITLRLLKKRIWHGIICAVNYLIQSILWVKIIAPNPQINHIVWLRWIGDQVSITGYFTQIYSIIRTIASLLFINQNYFISLVVVLVSFVCLLYLFIRQKSLYNLTTAIVLYLFTIIFLGIYPEPFNFARLTIYYPIVLLGIVLVIRQMVSYAVLQGILFIFIFLLSSYTTLSIFTNTPPNQINNTEILVDQILQDYYNSCRTSCPLIPSLRIYSIKNIAEEADGLTGPYWYFLEKLSGRKLVTLVNYGNNLEPIIEDPDQHYLICPILERNKNFVKGLCIEEYIKIHDNLASRLYTIMTLPTEELNNLYVVYKWSNNN